MENDKVKVYFIDLDGTLVDEKGSVSRKNILQVRETIKNGQHVVISTGRIGESVHNIMVKTGVEYAVTGNGSKIIDINDNILKEVLLTTQQIVQIMQVVKQHKLLVRIDGNKNLYGCRRFWQNKIAKKFHMIPTKRYNIQANKKHYKIVLLGVTKKNIKKIMHKLKGAVKDVSIVSSSGGWIIEITHKKATKGNGNAFVAKMLNITSKKHRIHIGDTMNDSTAKSSCKLVAMKNATLELKKTSDYIGPTYKNGGVAKVLRGQYVKNKNIELNREK